MRAEQPEPEGPRAVGPRPHHPRMELRPLPESRGERGGTYLPLGPWAQSLPLCLHSAPGASPYRGGENRVRARAAPARKAG